MNFPPHFSKKISPFVLLLSSAAAFAIFAVPNQTAEKTLTRLDQETPEKNAGNPALKPLFTLKWRDNKEQEIFFSSWDNSIRVINFWAFWCAPCIEEMPMLSRLQEKYRAKGVHFIGIAIDSDKKNHAFMARSTFSYPLIYSPAAEEYDMLSLSQKLGNIGMGLPFTLVLDKNGDTIGKISGLPQKKELEKLIEKALSENRNKKR